MTCPPQSHCGLSSVGFPGSCFSLLFSHTLPLAVWIVTSTHTLPTPLSPALACCPSFWHKHPVAWWTSPPDVPQAPNLKWVPNWTWHLHLSCVFCVSGWWDYPLNDPSLKCESSDSSSSLTPALSSHLIKTIPSSPPPLTESAARESQSGSWLWVPLSGLSFLLLRSKLKRVPSTQAQGQGSCQLLQSMGKLTPHAQGQPQKPEHASRSRCCDKIWLRRFINPKSTYLILVLMHGN